MYYLYWIHLPEHTDMFIQGYIGITKRPQRRLLEHKNRGENDHLKNAFLKYDNVSFTIIIVGTKEYCLYLEKILRPTDHIGWNIAIGGGLPPDLTGLIRPETTREKMRAARKRRPPMSEYTKQKISISKTGVPSGRLGIKIGSYHNERMLREGKHVSQIKKECCYCGKILDAANYARHHGDKCKRKMK